MLPSTDTPLIRLGNLFPSRQVHGKCEFAALSGSFKIRGAVHLLERLAQEGRTRRLVVPSMGNTALGAAVGARAYGFHMIGVVPTTLTRAKDEKLRALGVELRKVEGGGNALLTTAQQVAREQDGYFMHPHLDSLWTDGYQAIAAEVLRDLPGCRSLVFPLGGGGLLMGLTAWFQAHPTSVRLIGCEAYNFPTYGSYTHERSATIADGLTLGQPHPEVRERIGQAGVTLRMVPDSALRSAMRGLYRAQALVVEPAAVAPLAYVADHMEELEEPVCIILTGANIALEDFRRLIAE